MSNHTAVVLDTADLALLVEGSGIAPAMGSPLLEVVARGGTRDGLRASSALAEAEWIDPEGPIRLTDHGHATMTSLLRPVVGGRSVLGTRAELGTLGLYASDPEGPYVAMSESMDDDSILVTPGRAFADLSNAVTAQLLVGPMEISIGFGAALDPEEFVAMAAIFDWRTRTLLRATLDRDPLPEVQFNPTDLWEMIVEGRLTEDPAWAATLFASLLPQIDFALSEEAVAAAVGRMAGKGLVTSAQDGWWRCSPPLEELADAIQPFGSYAAVHLEIWDGDEPIEAAHYAFVRGPFAVVVARPIVVDDRRVVTVDAVSDIEIADLLTDLAAVPTVQRSPGAKDRCPGCGGGIESSQRFCALCGTALSPSDGDAP